MKHATFFASVLAVGLTAGIATSASAISLGDAAPVPLPGIVDQVVQTPVVSEQAQNDDNWQTWREGLREERETRRATIKEKVFEALADEEDSATAVVAPMSSSVVAPASPEEILRANIQNFHSKLSGIATRIGAQIAVASGEGRDMSAALADLASAQASLGLVITESSDIENGVSQAEMRLSYTSSRTALKLAYEKLLDAVENLQK